MKRLGFAVSLSLSIGIPHRASARENAVAIISYEIDAFKEALSGFEETAGESVRTIHLANQSLDLRGEPRAVVAFGGKAALQRYPNASALIYCMAPGTHIPAADRSSSVTEVSMIPEPGLLLNTLLSLQPSLKRLAILWGAPSNADYVNELRKTARARGIEISGERLSRSEELPDRLRNLVGRVDAFWLPPDPLVINEQNVVLAAQFSASAHLPYYSSAAGLAEKGAVASVSVSYSDVGRTTGAALNSLLKGAALPLVLYPSATRVTVNLTAAAEAGIKPNKDVLSRCEKVIP